MDKLILTYALSFVAAIASVSACSEAKHAYDCVKICNRYKECFDSSYDTTSCVDKCRNHADDDTSYAKHAEGCQSCIEGKSCVGATFSCGVECSDIVP